MTKSVKHGLELCVLRDPSEKQMLESDNEYE